MDFREGFAGRERVIVDLFAAAFAASEGAEEGAAIGGLVRALLDGTPDRDIFVFTASDAGMIVGACIFSRLAFDRDDRSVFVLGPVAVAPDRQREGIGKRLLDHGLAALREAGVDIAVTYGDPAYYSRVGFLPVTEALVPAPLSLTRPEGWLAQSLTGRDLSPLAGPSRCVAALNDPAFW